jgi:hypothetical protein
VIAGEGIFQRLCVAERIVTAVAALSAAELVEVIGWMEDREPGEVSGEVWAACTNEAKERWINLMKGETEQ